ncbi:aquaporin SIP1-2 isoform X1 [Silene latifolia]|uniref:aquaporin SIP1-2 isoform X1 n=1 Tax=Silene latifolia TaxID=37657 RepID=UPI003D787A82
MAATTTAVAIKLAIADGILTAMWVFSASTIGLFTYLISTSIGVQGSFTLVITTAIVATLVFIFTFVGQLLGGASFNPTGTAAFYAAGLTQDSLFSMALRFPAQAAGAVGGAWAISEVMPSQYKHMLGGPSIKVDLHTAAAAEGVLTFLISLNVLIILLKVPGGSLVKTWLLAMATVTLVVLGSGYTGPSMNPANAFGWAYMKGMHNTWDQFYVYWICPFIGAILAAMVFRAIFPEPKKPKKAPKNKKAD